MAYQNTSATDVSDLLDKLYTFGTVTDGAWTGEYNEVTIVGPPEIRQIAMEVSNCHLAMGTRTADLNIDKAGETDGYTSAALSSSLDSGPPYQYHDHPDSIVTTETDNDRVRCNDLGEPPFINVWFFSGGAGDVEYIHMVVQTAGERYSHFSVGIIDPVGQTHAECAFCCSMWWEWWLSSFTNNNPASDNHNCGYYWGDDEEGQVFIPHSVSDPVLPTGFQDVSPNGLPFNGSQLTTVMKRDWEDEDHWNPPSQGRILDFTLPSYNQPTTGGTVMWALPMLFRDTGSPRSHIMLGVLPGVRYARIDDVAPGTVLTYGSEEWVIFPFKRKGLRDNTVSGSDPVDLVNTIEYGLAYKKNT
jgi:hypothetical protein